jgi:hypothetical protein
MTGVRTLSNGILAKRKHDQIGIRLAFRDIFFLMPSRLDDFKFVLFPFRELAECGCRPQISGIGRKGQRDEIKI